MSSEPQLDLFTPRGPRIFTVGELTAEIRRILEGRYQMVWVSGEISNFRRQSSGHCYFALKDDGAQISAVLFRGQARYVRFRLEDGLEVLVRGRVSVYEPRGQYQLIVDEVEPRGLGALQAAFEALKARLEAEGLFDPARKKALPLLPRRIGLVTSPTGAAIRDFLRVVHRRHPRADVLVAPARVQGEGAAEEIARQLARLDARGDCDVLVVTRGGGSVEDLWAFNEEVLARAIAACRTPVMSAVGHEVDFTIADFVADVRAPTPSAAAELVVPEVLRLERELRETRHRLGRSMARDLDARRAGVERLWGRVEDPRRLMAGHRLRLEDLRARVEAAPTRRLRDEERTLRRLDERLGRQHPRERLGRLQGELDRASMQLASRIERRLAEARRVHGELAGKLEALSPFAILERGYGLVRTADGRVVRRAADVAEGEAIRVDLSEGRLHATVTRTEERASEDEA